MEYYLEKEMNELELRSERISKTKCLMKESKSQRNIHSVMVNFMCQIDEAIAHSF